MTSKNALLELPTIETPRLVLRKMTLDDAQDIFEYASDPEVARYVTWPAHRSIEDALSFLRVVQREYEAGGPSSWGIVHKADRKLIGTIGFVRWEPNNSLAEIGYALSQKYWNMGLMTEVVQEVIRFGFEKMGINRLQAMCMIENTASERVMRKCGMTFEGILREYVRIKGITRDLKVYSILRREFERGRREFERGQKPG